MFFTNLKFKNKILVAFLFVFIPLILVGSAIAYYQVKKNIQANIEKELQNTTDSLVNLIYTSASVSIKTRLHAIAEKNLDIAEHYFNKYRSGLLTKPEAAEIIEEIFLSQTVGVSGYIYCLNSQGIVTVHPNDRVKNSNVSEFDFVRQQMRMKDGYLEYDWKNPGEAQERSKALYMVYFEPLDWIISVSTYREEFSYLVDIKDFRENILSYTSGKTGYAFVLDEEGKAIVHPKIQGINILQRTDYPHEFLQQMLHEKNGKVKYFWKNPMDPEPREKIVFFRHIPEYHWVVASSSYVEEVFSPLKTFRNFLMVVLSIIIISSVGITYLVSGSVTKPMRLLMEKLEKGTRGDFSVRMADGGPDEFGQLSRHFNSFMAQLEQDQEKIETEIQKNVEARAALVENDLKLRGLFNQSFQFTGILSPFGIVEEINQTALDFIGCSTGDVLYKPFWETPWWRHDPDVRQELKTAVQKAAQGEMVRYDTSNISKDGEIRYFDISIKPVFNPQGEVAFIIAEGRDITEYKLAAQERKKIAVQMEKSQNIEVIGTLAGGIAHDFNNILSGIIGYAQLAEMNLDNPIKTKGYLFQILKGAQRATGLIQQILTFSRQTEYEKLPLRLHLVVKETLNLLRSSIPTTIEIKSNIVSSAKVLADSTQMHQVVMNLCTNAYHAMGDTGGTLTVQLQEVEISGDTDIFGQKMPQGKFLELEISDTGQGMDDETLLKAFDPYFTTKGVGKGTGFGLALVQAIVEEHDGYIKVESSRGQGSSFYVYLPAVTLDAAQENGQTEEKEIKGGTETVMFVDDDEDIRMIVREFLSTCGYTVHAFENGVHAFEAFEQDPGQFDLIITDMTMPRMAGDELSMKILALRKDLPVILCTGYSETVSEAKALEMGIRKYLQKPVDNEDLALVIRQILDTEIMG